jgi:beta-galactosidase
MKPLHWILISLFVFVTAWLILTTSNIQSRIEERIDLNWRYILADDTSFCNSNYDDSEWQIVSLPHDWMITQAPDSTCSSGTAGGFYPGGIAWYRKQLDLSEYQEKEKFYLVFDGVYMNAEVWVNGKYAGGHKYGYIGFHFDISDIVKKDSVNIIAVRTDCSERPMDRWYSGGGIYRHVKLIATTSLHFPVLNTRITTNKAGNDHVVKSLTSIVNNDHRTRKFKIKSDLIDPKGKLIESTIVSKTIHGKDTLLFSIENHLPDPLLWSPDNPDQYELRTYLIYHKKVIDNLKNKFGIREVQFSADSGFILNGKKVWLKGVCIHHDGGALGSAVPDATWEYRLKALKSLEVNALRLAHNPHSPEVLDLCDKLGLLVINEMYDKWEMAWDNGSFDFINTYKKDLPYFIQRDMNHPSIIAWSLGNETVEQLEDPEKGVRWFERLAKLTRSIDSSRMITCALHPGNFFKGQENLPSNYIHIEPLVSYNYRTDYFSEWHEKYPEIIWMATETKAYNESLTSDFETISYKDNSWLDMEKFVAGQFIWAGIDYLGESSGWPYRSFYNGLLQTNARVKPFTYYTKSIYSEEEMVKIVVVDKKLADSLNNETTWQLSWSGAPVVRHWNFENQVDELDIIVYTNCPEVELQLNDSLCHYLVARDFDDGVIKTKLKYAPGVLSAKAFYKTENGSREFVSDSILTASQPRMIIMEPDKTEFLSDGADVVHIETRVADSIGTTFPGANNMISYEVRGSGNIRVIDNGNPADTSPFSATRKRVFHGSHLVILQSNLEPGDLIISASSEGLLSASLKLNSVAVKNIKK